MLPLLFKHGEDAGRRFIALLLAADIVDAPIGTPLRNKMARWVARLTTSRPVRPARRWAPRHIARSSGSERLEDGSAARVDGWEAGGRCRHRQDKSAESHFIRDGSRDLGINPIREFLCRPKGCCHMAVSRTCGRRKCTRVQLVIASAMVIATVFIHLVGLAVLVRILRPGAGIRSRTCPPNHLAAWSIVWNLRHSYGRDLVVRIAIPVARSGGGFRAVALFSTVTYASIGSGTCLSQSMRILGAIEGAAGVIMLGWSTAFLVSLLAQSKLLA